MVPVGYYGRARGKAGRQGGDLQRSLVTEYLGRSGQTLSARCTSILPYANRQHEEAFYHPGIYQGKGIPRKKYAAKYFGRAVELVFGSGSDPLDDYNGPKVPTFKELLAEPAP
jgi:hypothetical protein